MYLSSDVNTARQRHTPHSRFERLLAHLADRRDSSGPSHARVDLIHDIHVVPVPHER